MGDRIYIYDSPYRAPAIAEAFSDIMNWPYTLE